MNFNKQTVLISGASSGLGREFALQMHQQGANLVLVARRIDLLNELKNGLEQFRPQSVKVIACNLCDSTSASFKELIDFIEHERIDVLVNNAGRGSFGYFDQLPLTSEVEMVELNILATMRLAHAVIPQMRKRRSGTIISVSSIAGFQPLPFMSSYAATKAFNLYHSLGLWAELKEFGIRTMVVCPGPVATEFGVVARVPGTVTGGARDSAQAVVGWVLSDFNNGKIISLPGFKAKGLVWLIGLLPRQFLTAFVAKKLKAVMAQVKYSL